MRFSHNTVFSFKILKMIIIIILLLQDYKTSFLKGWHSQMDGKSDTAPYLKIKI